MGFRFTILLFIFSFLTSVSGQESDYIYTQFTTSNGLPSNECHDIIQDSRGYIWLATDNGVARFDGTTFYRYGFEEGLGDLVIFELKEDKLGRIWAGGYNNQLFIYNQTKDVFEPYQYNHVLKKYALGYSGSAKGFYFSKTNDLHIPRVNVGQLIITESGTTSLDSICNDGRYFIYSERKNDLMVFNSPRALKKKGFYNVKLINRNNCDTSPLVKVDTYGDPNDILFGFCRTEKQFVCHINESIFEIQNDKIKWSRWEKEVNRIQRNSEDKFVVSFDGNKGIRLYEDLKNDKYEILFNDISASGFLEDEVGGYWICSLDKGLFYIKNTNIKYITSLHKNKLYPHISLDQRGSLYTANFEGLIEKIDFENRYVDIVKFEDGINYGLLEYNNDDKSLWVSNAEELLVYKEGQKEQVVQGYTKNGLINRLSSKSIFFSENDVYTVKINNELYKIDPKKLLIDKDFEFGESNKLSSQRVRSIYFTSNKELAVGTIGGLISLDVESKEIRISEDSLLKYRIDKILEDKKSNLYYASKGAGLIIHPKDGKPYNINESNGLISNQLEDIIFGKEESIIWVATLKGISKVEFFSDSYLIQNYTVHHGLPVPDVYDLEWYDDKLYAGTGKGVVELSERNKNEYSKIPKLLTFEVNGELHDINNDSKLDYTEKNVYMSFSSINFNLGKDHNFRYRINENNWIPTDKKNLYLVNLSSNKYKVEFQSQNEDGFWSISSIVRFSISKVWWSTWWFLLAIVLVGGTSLTYHFLRREKRLKKENSIQEELRSLEKAALQSQMNPHFIFNCLNSIQRFIMDNDKLSAMDYLSRFAKLIRLTLNASVEKEISLNEEIKILDYYLGLEKLRFKNKFNYEIIVENNIDKYDTFLSPLLIQPLVENAIKHGVSSREYGGIIFVHFKKENDHLSVTVRDNGNGVETAQPLFDDQEGHRSFGMKITGDRLGLADGIKVERVDDWTEVSILV